VWRYTVLTSKRFMMVTIYPVPREMDEVDYGESAKVVRKLRI
jgi:hypothetical protein